MASTSRNNNGEFDNDNYADEFDSFPPGIRFTPSDIELIVYYLLRKIHNIPPPPNRIREEPELLKYSPPELATKYKSDNGKEWYFFAYQKRKYPNGNRPDRSAGNGFWKPTGRDLVIKNKGRVLGYKKNLDFRIGKQPDGEKTDWKMHEYRLDKIFIPENKRTRDGCNRLDDWILCKIYNKKYEGDAGEEENQRVVKEENQHDNVIDEEVDTIQQHAVNSASNGSFQNSYLENSLGSSGIAPQHDHYSNDMPGSNNFSAEINQPNIINRGAIADGYNFNNNLQFAANDPNFLFKTALNNGQQNITSNGALKNGYFNKYPEFGSNGVVPSYHFPNHSMFNSSAEASQQYNITSGAEFANGYSYKKHGLNSKGVLNSDCFPNYTGLNTFSAETSQQNITSSRALANGYVYSNHGFETNGAVNRENFPNSTPFNNLSNQQNIAEARYCRNSIGFDTNGATLQNPFPNDKMFNDFAAGTSQQNNYTSTGAVEDDFFNGIETCGYHENNSDPIDNCSTETSLQSSKSIRGNDDGCYNQKSSSMSIVNPDLPIIGIQNSNDIKAEPLAMILPSEWSISETNDAAQIVEPKTSNNTSSGNVPPSSPPIMQEWTFELTCELEY
ncbi:hypothetical protein ACFE04_000477 [Oxalis oulophora]